MDSCFLCGKEISFAEGFSQVNGIVFCWSCSKGLVSDFVKVESYVSVDPFVLAGYFFRRVFHGF